MHTWCGEVSSHLVETQDSVCVWCVKFCSIYNSALHGGIKFRTRNDDNSNAHPTQNFAPITRCSVTQAPKSSSLRSGLWDHAKVSAWVMPHGKTLTFRRSSSYIFCHSSIPLPSYSQARWESGVKSNGTDPKMRLQDCGQPSRRSSCAWPGLPRNGWHLELRVHLQWRHLAEHPLPSAHHSSLLLFGPILGHMVEMDSGGPRGGHGPPHLRTPLGHRLAAQGNCSEGNPSF